MVLASQPLCHCVLLKCRVFHCVLAARFIILNLVGFYIHLCIAIKLQVGFVLQELIQSALMLRGVFQVTAVGFGTS